MTPYLSYSVLFFVAAVTPLLVVALLLRRSSWPSPDARVRVQRLLLVVATLACLHLAFDLALLGFVRSDGFGQSVAAKLWKRRHWKPINAQGFRDREHSLADLTSHRVVAVVGDSFAAGSGIEDPADRFADRLGARLGPGFRVVVLAKPGWGPPRELAALEALPVDPELVVLAHYVNDVQPACEDAGERPPTLRLAQPARPLRRHVERSPFASFLHWRVARVLEEAREVYPAWVAACWSRPEVVARHRRQIEALAHESARRGARFVVVVIPLLIDLDWSRPIAEPFVDWLDASGIERVHLLPLLEGRPTASLVVNDQDAHASVALHAEIAELLLAVLDHEGERPL